MKTYKITWLVNHGKVGGAKENKEHKLQETRVTGNAHESRRSVTLNLRTSLPARNPLTHVTKTIARCLLLAPLKREFLPRKKKEKKPEVTKIPYRKSP